MGTIKKKQKSKYSNLLLFLHTKSVLKDREIKKTIFDIASKKMKYLGVNKGSERPIHRKL